MKNESFTGIPIGTGRESIGTACRDCNLQRRNYSTGTVRGTIEQPQLEHFHKNNYNGTQMVVVDCIRRCEV